MQIRKFQQGRPDLLAEIKKSNQNESADKQDVDHLKSEVRMLSDRLWTATREIEQLKKLVGSLIESGTEIKHANYHSEMSAKKRKLIHDGPPSPIASTGDVLLGTENETISPLQVHSHTIDMGAKGDVIPAATEETQFMPPMVKPNSAVRIDSVGVGAFSVQEEEMLASLFALDNTDDVKMLESMELPDAVHSNLVDVAPKPSPDVSPKLMEKVRASLAALPREMQELFVDRLVAVIGAPDALNLQVEAMTSLATAAAEEARRRLVSNGRSEDDPELANMTLAVLEAYLTRLIRKAKVEESTNSVATNAHLQS